MLCPEQDIASRACSSGSGTEEATYLLSFDTYTWQAIQNAIAPELSMLAGRTHPADRVYADNLRHADAVIRARIVPGVSA